MNQSWKAEVIADDSGTWATNNCRFKTRQEAEDYVRNLMMRWTLVRETRVSVSDDPVNARWNEENQTLHHLLPGEIMKPVNREELLDRLPWMQPSKGDVPIDRRLIEVTVDMVERGEWFDFGQLDKDACRRAALDAQPFRKAALLKPPYANCIFRMRLGDTPGAVDALLVIVAVTDEARRIALEGGVKTPNAQDAKDVDAVVLTILAFDTGHTELGGTHHIMNAANELAPEYYQYENLNTTVIYDALWLILNTKGIAKRVDVPSDKLNKARIKAGRPPLRQVTRIDASQYMRALDETERMERGGHHTSPRMHLRRAHLRWLKADRYSAEARSKPIMIEAMIVNIASDSIARRDHYEVRT